MLRNLSAGCVVAACAVLTVHVPAGAQQAGRPPVYPTEAQWAESTEAQRHITLARAAATPGLMNEFERTCTPLGPQRPALLVEAAGQTRAPRELVEPIRVFENLYYFGFSDVGSWAISTSDGIILIDALNTTQDAEEIIIPGLRKVGLDPAQIKYILVGHGHNDHVGGVSHFQDTYPGAEIMMTAADWDMAIAGARPDRPRPTRDVEVTHGQQVTLGDTTVTLAVTPGHTPGSLGFFIPIKHNGASHTVLLLSGVLQTPTPQDLVGLERVLNEARTMNVQAVVNGHPDIFYGQTLEAMQFAGAYGQSVARNPNAPHPLLYDSEQFGRYLTIMTECSRARVAAMASN
jgi:metallo-beta-lactamase class B